jgi:hypothetical protein
MFAKKTATNPRFSPTFFFVLFPWLILLSSMEHFLCDPDSHPPRSKLQLQPVGSAIDIDLDALFACRLGVPDHFEKFIDGVGR